jgi:hypothetical protein
MDHLLTATAFLEATSSGPQRIQALTVISAQMAKQNGV